MKIIDLLNKIANGEEVPKKIKYAGIIWEYDNTTKDYITDDMFLIYKMNSFALNKSFEILEEEPYVEICGRWFTKSEYDEFVKDEEEKKIPEKLDYLGLKIREGNLSKQDVIMLCDYIDYQTQTINQLLDYLKSKGE